jgi:hypothetical protein
MVEHERQAIAHEAHRHIGGQPQHVLGRIQRTWLLPQVDSGTRAPQSASGRARTVMRGLPASGRTWRIRLTGR